MDIKTQLNESVKDAMRSGDEVRKRTVRMVLAAVKQVEVDKRIAIDDLAVVALIPPLWIARARVIQSDQPRWHTFTDMDYQPKAKPQTVSALFADGRFAAEFCPEDEARLLPLTIRDTIPREAQGEPGSLVRDSLVLP